MTRFKVFILSLFLLAHTDDEPFADWMRSLMRPDMPHSSCCGPSDQNYVDSYEAAPDGGFDAEIKGLKIHIPPEKVIWDRVNPTGRGVIFTTHLDQAFISNGQSSVGHGYFIFCFVPGAGV